ncbi:MAG: type II secretion system protein [Verrucomicrobiota bacterium]
MKLSPLRRNSAFTMVEIALCLAIIGFALVAIIGTLPIGMDVQKNNREETVINEDATMWMDAIRSGSMGFDDVANYVLAITNYWTELDPTTLTPNGATKIDYYTPTASEITSATVTANPYRLIDGYRIVGLLSTPKYTFGNNYAQSNYVVAYVRAMSGAAVEKHPQDNPDVLQDAFTYRMIVENTPYVPTDVATNAAAIRTLRILQENSHDLRLLFRWPVLPNGKIGNGRQTYRLLFGGSITNRPEFGQPLYFFQPSTYGQLAK